jgi:S1-C subfamily serine protease
MFKEALLALLLLMVPVWLRGQAAETPPQQKTAGDIYKMAGLSVVLIETYGYDGEVSGSGSGFLVSADGRILTNFHVIEHTRRATVRLANEDAYDAVHVLAVDKRKDIALLLIDVANLSYRRLGRSASAQIGDKLYTLGTPPRLSAKHIVRGAFERCETDGWVQAFPVFCARQPGQFWKPYQTK